MAVYTPKKLYSGQPTTSATTLYTTPASTSTIVKNILMTNTTATDATITISFVPSGGTAGATNRVFTGYTVKANDTVAVDLSSVLSTSDFISALQGTSGAITIYISGVEVV